MRTISHSQKLLASFVLLILLGLLLAAPSTGYAGPQRQIPTGSIPTVTGTPVGALAVVLDNEQGFVNLRAGPSTVAYEIVGVLVTGQSIPAVGRSPGGDWIQVAYPGIAGGVAWVWKDLVDVRGTVPVVEPPPTPTPAITATIDPTLAAQFLVDVPPTRLPTYTPPPPFAMPTLPSDAPLASTGRFPMALFIIGLLVLGVVLLAISFLGR